MRNYTYLALLPKASKDVAFKCIPTNVEAFGGGGESQVLFWKKHPFRCCTKFQVISFKYAMMVVSV
jgi:hypothetical protein